MDKKTYRAGYVGIVGLPNAGKSTLVNALIGEKVSIVTAKAQTTRQRIQGILNTDSAQYIFVDAPGLVSANAGLNKFLQVEAEDIRENSDVLVAALNIDCDSEKKIDQVIDWVASSGKPWMAVITKTDLPEIHRSAKMASKLMKYDVPVISLCADKLTKAGRGEFLGALEKLLPESPAPLFDDDIYTTQTVREISAELIREKCFEYLQQEIPYGLAVRISSFKEDERIPKIHADILISKDNYRSIVIGSGGKKLRAIGSAARKDIEAMMGSKVFLDLHVSVKKKWMNNANHMKELGYVKND